MKVTIPATLDIVVPFLLSIGGIAFILFSKNVRAKRIAVPLTTGVFSATWFEIFRRGYAPTPPVLLVVAIALLANGVWVWRRIGYCPKCGRTIQDAGSGTLCAGCAAAV